MFLGVISLQAARDVCPSCTRLFEVFQLLIGAQPLRFPSSTILSTILHLYYLHFHFCCCFIVFRPVYSLQIPPIHTCLMLNAKLETVLFRQEVLDQSRLAHLLSESRGLRLQVNGAWIQMSAWPFFWVE